MSAALSEKVERYGTHGLMGKTTLLTGGGGVSKASEGLAVRMIPVDGSFAISDSNGLGERLPILLLSVFFAAFLSLAEINASITQIAKH